MQFLLHLLTFFTDYTLPSIFDIAVGRSRFEIQIMKKYCYIIFFNFYILLFSQTVWIICRLSENIMLLCSSSCRTLPLSVERNISIPLRMLEVFTNQKTYSWLTSEEDQSKIVLSIVSHLTTKGISHFKRKSFQYVYDWYKNYD